MKKLIVNHHKAHKALRWRIDVPAKRDPPERCPWAVPVAGAERPGMAGRVAFSSRPEVPELDFAAVRPGFVAACMVEAAGVRGGRRTRAGRCTRAGRSARPSPRRTAGAAGETRSPAPAEPRRGVSLSQDRALRYRIDRNGQMEHLTQVAASLRGGVRRGAAITPRERAAAADLASATFGDESGVQSNIFGFVAT
jgi:hypothetical protein